MDLFEMNTRIAKKPTASWRKTMGLTIVAGTRARREDLEACMRDVDAMSETERFDMLQGDEIPAWVEKNWNGANADRQLAALELKQREVEELSAAVVTTDADGKPAPPPVRGVLAMLEAKAVAAQADPESSVGEDMLSEAQKIIAKDPVGSTAPFKDAEDPYQAAIDHLLKVLTAARAANSEAGSEEDVRPRPLDERREENDAKDAEIKAAIKTAGVERVDGAYLLANQLGPDSAEWAQVASTVAKWPKAAVAEYMQQRNNHVAHEVAKFSIEDQLRVGGLGAPLRNR